MQDHNEESLALNLLNSTRELVACRPELGIILWTDSVAEGSAISGTVTASKVDVTISGNVTNLSRPFSAHIVATRPK